MADAKLNGAIFLQDYCPPAFLIDSIDLYFDLHDDTVTVRSRLAVRANPANLRPDLVLDGHDMVLQSLSLNGRELTAADYILGEETLTLPGVPEHFTLEIVTRLSPKDNTSLEGLYTSSGNFCTQCEAEGFRKITYYPDRPDVMARFTVTIEGDKAGYPVLLSNGNLVDSGEMDNGRHWARWEDPFPKPSYLFALVAGDLACIADEFVTASGRWVQLLLYVQHHNVDKCEHAMNSLKKAMAWDEQVYGREYDLDVYMIVAVDDFNMGAMENKGLNVFNSRYVLARPDTATDADYQGIEGVIAHEYFHNWSGNRVTCRDWFQLSLKEGFTVFRDQEFSADINSRGVARIGDVNVLRSHQFREDAGPMAHPVRPDSYEEINNFYTVTVYNKGAEVVRMLHHLLGAAGFRKGTDLYFERHDGQAVTTEDFVKALEDANGADLKQFRRWYTQAGTPEITVQRHYDAAHKRYTLTLSQHCPPTPGQESKEPFHIPVAMGLLDGEGRDLPLRLQGAGLCEAPTTRVLELTEATQQFVFEGITEAPIPSLLRGFSAPVKLNIDFSRKERAFLMAHDSDGFNRWEAGQQLAVELICEGVKRHQAGEGLHADPLWLDAMHQALQSGDQDEALIASALGLPSETYLAEFVKPVDPEAIHQVRRFLKRAFAEHARETLMTQYEKLADDGDYRLDPKAMGRRSLRNTCLSYLMELDDVAIRAQCLRQFREGGNMTDVMAALACLANSEGGERDTALAEFHDRWKADPLVMDKWLSIQASSRLPDTLQRVRALTAHPVFSLKNPNKVRALIGAFSAANPRHFHAADGSGYAFVAENLLELDKLNPQVAARLARGFSQWRQYDEGRQGLMRKQLETMLAVSGLSKDMHEVVAKTLG